LNKQRPDIAFLAEPMTSYVDLHPNSLIDLDYRWLFSLSDSKIVKIWRLARIDLVVSPVINVSSHYNVVFVVLQGKP